MHICPPEPYDPSHDQTARCMNWIFLISSLNFSFWSAEGEAERFGIEWREGWESETREVHTGYWSLVAAIDRGNYFPVRNTALMLINVLYSVRRRHSHYRPNLLRLRKILPRFCDRAYVPPCTSKQRNNTPYQRAHCYPTRSGVHHDQREYLHKQSFIRSLELTMSCSDSGDPSKTSSLNSKSDTMGVEQRYNWLG